MRKQNIKTFGIGLAIVIIIYPSLLVINSMNDDIFEFILALFMLSVGFIMSFLINPLHDRIYGKKVKVKIVTKATTLPIYAKIDDSGMDIKYNGALAKEILPRETKLFATGIYVKIPKGYEIQIRSRSGLSLKNSVFVLNSPGTIDSGYTGEIGIILHNASLKPYKVIPKQNIAQLVLTKVEKIEWESIESVELLDVTERGSGGFGHTDKLSLCHG